MPFGCFHVVDIHPSRSGVNGEHAVSKIPEITNGDVKALALAELGAEQNGLLWSAPCPTNAA